MSGLVFTSRGQAAQFTFRKLAGILIVAMASTLTFSGKGHAELVVVVNSQLPVDNLTQHEVAQIFLGRLRLFPGTRTRPILLDSKFDSAPYRQFYQKLVRLSPLKIKRYRTSYMFGGRGSLPTELSDEKAILEYIQNNPSAIGYLHRDTVEGRRQDSVDHRAEGSLTPAEGFLIPAEGSLKPAEGSIKIVYQLP